MRILLQPAAILGALKNFDFSINNGIPLEFFKDKVDVKIFNKLEELSENNIRVWGIEPLQREPIRKAWKDINADDLILFYRQHKFIYMGRVYFKIHSDALAKAIWGENKNGVSWEYIYFVKEGKQIEVPYDPTVIGNKENQVIQRAYALNDTDSILLRNYIDEKCGEFIDESIVQPSTELTEKIYSKSLKLKSPEEILKEIEAISVEAETRPVKEKVTMAKALSRNYKFARLVKERAQFICEICGSKPFMQKSGLPYAEAHHIDELAKTRIDSPNKMICVCPNCHRVLHYGDDASLSERKKMK